MLSNRKATFVDTGVKQAGKKEERQKERETCCIKSSKSKRSTANVYNLLWSHSWDGWQIVICQRRTPDVHLGNEMMQIPHKSGVIVKLKLTALELHLVMEHMSGKPPVMLHSERYSNSTVWMSHGRRIMLGNSKKAKHLGCRSRCRRWCSIPQRLDCRCAWKKTIRHLSCLAVPNPRSWTQNRKKPCKSSVTDG